MMLRVPLGTGNNLYNWSNPPLNQTINLLPDCPLILRLSIIPVQDKFQLTVILPVMIPETINWYKRVFNNIRHNDYLRINLPGPNGLRNIPNTRADHNKEIGILEELQNQY
jgi:hypothetical protein